MSDPEDAQLGEHARQRGESEDELLDRNVNEVLQELRVMQTGVQILFAFLLGLAFTPVFDKVTELQKWVYVVTLLLTAASTALFIAPVAHHRFLFRQGMRRELVEGANRMALGGLMLLMGAMVGAVLLILDVVVGDLLAAVLTFVTAVWFAAFWLAHPLIQRSRSRRGDSSP